MPVFMLDETMVFPDPNHANRDGLLAVGGDLSSERLVEAYSKGIFPWFEDGSPILWWSPDPRLILFPDQFRISHSLKQKLASGKFEVRFDTCFDRVIRACAEVPRLGQDGTWITEEMIEAYIELNRLGIAHSVETFREEKLVGGLYGIALGKAFFGESMFHIETDASKIALAILVEKLRDEAFHFIDAQQNTAHMRRLGAVPIRRDRFLSILKQAVSYRTKHKKW